MLILKKAGWVIMFINELNKKEAVHFINLFQSLANADESFAESEEELLMEYMEELSVNKEDIKVTSFNNSVECLKQCNDRIKNIIYFELLGLALTDGSYDKREIDLLNNIANEFSISSSKQKDFLDYFKRLNELYNSDFFNFEGKIQSLKEEAEKLI